MHSVQARHLTRCNIELSACKLYLSQVTKAIQDPVVDCVQPMCYVTVLPNHQDFCDFAAFAGFGIDRAGSGDGLSIEICVEIFE